MHTHDFDEDGYPDLLGVKDDAVFWLRNNGAGLFYDDIGSRNQINKDSISVYRGVAIEDIDKDGDKDVVWYGRHDGIYRLEWSENIGKGVFGKVHNYEELKTNNLIQELVIADFNNDKNKDLLLPTLRESVFWYATDDSGIIQESHLFRHVAAILKVQIMS